MGVAVVVHLSMLPWPRRKTKEHSGSSSKSPNNDSSSSFIGNVATSASSNVGPTNAGVSNDKSDIQLNSTPKLPNISESPPTNSKRGGSPNGLMCNGDDGDVSSPPSSAESDGAVEIGGVAGDGVLGEATGGGAVVVAVTIV